MVVVGEHLRCCSCVSVIHVTDADVNPGLFFDPNNLRWWCSVDGALVDTEAEYRLTFKRLAYNLKLTAARGNEHGAGVSTPLHKL